jgi:hypothetical protein
MLIFNPQKFAKFFSIPDKDMDAIAGSYVPEFDGLPTCEFIEFTVAATEKVEDKEHALVIFKGLVEKAESFSDKITPEDYMKNRFDSICLQIRKSELFSIIAEKIIRSIREDVENDTQGIKNRMSGDSKSGLKSEIKTSEDITEDMLFCSDVEDSIRKDGEDDDGTSKVAGVDFGKLGIITDLRDCDGKVLRVGDIVSISETHKLRIKDEKKDRQMTKISMSIVVYNDVLGGSTLVGEGHHDDCVASMNNPMNRIKLIVPESSIEEDTFMVIEKWRLDYRHARTNPKNLS